MKKPWMKVSRTESDVFEVVFDARDWQKASDAILSVRNGPPPGYRLLEGATDRDDDHKAGQRCRVTLVLQKINRTLPDMTIPSVSTWMEPVAKRALVAQKESEHGRREGDETNSAEADRSNG